MGAIAQRVHGDLVLLRRTSVSQFVDLKLAPTLLWYVGRGSIGTTLSFLHALRTVDDDHIQAALATLGLRGSSSNREDQLNTFASDHEFRSSRTIRRWSDAGLVKIASLVEEWALEEGNDGPHLDVLLFQRTPTHVNLSFRLTFADASLMFDPAVNVGGQSITVDLSAPTPHAVPGFRSQRGSADVALDPAEPTKAWCEIAWHGASDPSFEVTCHPSLSVLVGWHAAKGSCWLTFSDTETADLEQPRGAEAWTSVSWKAP